MLKVYKNLHNSIINTRKKQGKFEYTSQNKGTKKVLMFSSFFVSLIMI